MKQTKEFLKEMNISEQNPAVLEIYKLVEKAPNYEFFFIKSHFGREHVALESIKNNFHLMKEKNIKVSKSVDQYVKFVVSRPFKNKEILIDGKEVEKRYNLGDVVTRSFYKSLPDYHQKNIEIRTDFESFSDEIRDAHTKLIANRVIQEFPASAKAVVESLTPAEKKELYYNLSTLYLTNFNYIVVNSFVHNEKKYVRSSKLSQEEFKAIPASVTEGNVIQHVEPTYTSFIAKCARYRTKEILLNDVNVALYSMHGSEEYKEFIKIIEETEGAFLEGLNPDKGIIVASALNAHSYSKIGGNKTNHCISASYGSSAPTTFNSTVAFGYKQFLIINTELPPSDIKRIIGMTIDDRGNVTRAHAKNDHNLIKEVTDLLKSWGVLQHIRPMTAEDILESLYHGIENETIFTDKNRCDMVIRYIDKLDPKRYQRKKLLNFIRFTHKPDEMRKIVRESLDISTSEKFLENYDYLVHNILKLITDDEQATNIVRSFVIEYNSKLGITKEDALSLLVNKSKFVQPNILTDIITEDKFYEYCMQYNEEQIKSLLAAVPQFYVNFLRDRKNITDNEIGLILIAIYVYETRKDIRQLVLVKLQTKGYFTRIPKDRIKEYSTRIISDITNSKDTEVNESTARNLNAMTDHLKALGYDVSSVNVETIDIESIAKKNAQPAIKRMSINF
jgi:hypothetical protein